MTKRNEKMNNHQSADDLTALEETPESIQCLPVEQRTEEMKMMKQLND